MSMCPYKWFIYLASLWALAYVMLEAFMQYRTVRKELDKPGYEPIMAGSDSEWDDEEEEEEDDDTSLELAARLVRPPVFIS